MEESSKRIARDGIGFTPTQMEVKKMPNDKSCVDVAVIGERVDVMRIELSEMHKAIREMAHAITKIALIENHYSHLSTEVLDLRQKVSEIERKELIELVRHQTTKKLARIAWTALSGGGLYIVWVIASHFYQ